MKRSLLVILLVFAAAVVIAGSAKEEKSFKNGLVAHYFQDPEEWNGKWPGETSEPLDDPLNWTFTTYKYSRVEPVINHLFIKKGWFTVRWTGWFDPATPGGDKGNKDKDDGDDDEAGAEYFFEILADDGCRLIINGKTVIDDWNARWELEPEALRKAKGIRLPTGKHDIVVEYFQGQSLKRDDHDPIKVYWSCPERKIPKQIVPAAHFSHGKEHLESSDRPKK
ncbi:PA14 domain-containing protein [Verrucomicrobiota bacterium]